MPASLVSPNRARTLNTRFLVCAALTLIQFAPRIFRVCYNALVYLLSSWALFPFVVFCLYP